MGIRNDATLQAIGYIAIFLIVAAIIGGLCLLVAWPFMWVWNYAVVSAVTIAKPINYWVAFWLSLFVALWLRPSTSAKSSS